MTCPLNYFEVAEIHTRKALAVIKQFKVHFVRHGIPEIVITDNCSAFANEASSPLNGSSSTSSPRYPQSNGKAENAVKTCKELFRKAKEDEKDLLLAILDWRNTPEIAFAGDALVLHTVLTGR